MHAAGVPDTDFKTLYTDMQRFFALDSATKMQVCTTTNPNNRGWTPLGEETLGASHAHAHLEHAHSMPIRSHNHNQKMDRKKGRKLGT